MTEWLAVFAGWMVVALLVSAGLAKVLRPGDLPVLRLTGKRAMLASRALGLAEVVVAAALVAAPDARIAAKLALVGLTSGFVSVAELAYRRGVPCGCGGRSNRPATLATVVRAYACFLAAMVVLLFLDESTSMLETVPAALGLLAATALLWALGRNGGGATGREEVSPPDGASVLTRRSVLGGVLLAAAGG